jgi:hypothetical protein
VPSKLFDALLIAGALACDRTPKGEQASESAATLATPEEDRSLENDGCAIDFAYRQPYYTRDNGFRPLPRVRDAAPGMIAIELISSGVPTVALDEGGRVFRYSQTDAGAPKYLLTGQVEVQVLSRVLASRRHAAKSPLRGFAPPGYCYDMEGSREIRVYGIDPSPRSPVLLGSANPDSATRRVSKNADVLTRWILSVESRALQVPPFCDTNQTGPECIP